MARPVSGVEWESIRPTKKLRNTGIARWHCRRNKREGISRPSLEPEFSEGGGKLCNRKHKCGADVEIPNGVIFVES